MAAAKLASSCAVTKTTDVWSPLRLIRCSSSRPLDPGQADIDDEAVGVVLILEVCLSRFERMDEVAVRTEQPADCTSNVLVVVDDDKGQPRRWGPHRMVVGE